VRPSGALLARAGLDALPGVSALHRRGRSRAADLPERTLTLDAVVVDRERLAAYDRVCGFTVRNLIPATYPHTLAFPLALELITDRSFPLPALGLVHVANRIVQHRPIDAREQLSLSVRTADLRSHRRGRQFDLRTDVRVDDDLVWEETATMLRVEHRQPRDSDRAAAPAEPLPATASWELRGDLGRRYAAVSGDFNPIHLHPLTARAFGFRGAIVHGMWTQARCLAALDSILPAGYTVEVAFKRPIVLPATVEFAERAGDERDPLRFEVRSARDGTPHLEGTLAPAAPILLR
jgi:acyl dehydratase